MQRQLLETFRTANRTVSNWCLEYTWSIKRPRTCKCSYDPPTVGSEGRACLWHWAFGREIRTVHSLKSACLRTVGHGRSREEVLRADGQAAVGGSAELLCAEREGGPDRECGVPLRNNQQGLHADERAAPPPRRRRPRYPGCTLQPVRASGESRYKKHLQLRNYCNYSFFFFLRR